MQVRRCPTCDRAYVARRETCVVDHAPLGPLTDAPGDHFLGRSIRDRYVIEGRIGLGGHGAVYLARQLSVDRDVAIKMLREEASSRDDLAARFEREARIVAQLRHPNTVRVHDHGRTVDGRLFLVTELLDGQPLDALLEAGPIGEALTLDVLAAVCGSLAEAHAMGVVHRDLKPGNIFLARIAGETVVKVLDFGIAKSSEDATLTVGGDIFGTPAYIAPEQARGDAIDDRTDLYSLGVVAYECLAGARPFDARNGMGLLLKHLNEAPPPLPSTVEVSPALRELVFGMLEKRPDDRPPSALTVCDMIASIVTSQSLPRPTALTPVAAIAPPRRVARRTRWPLWVAGAALVAGVAVWAALPTPHAPVADDVRVPPSEAAAQVPPSEAAPMPVSEAPAQVPSSAAAQVPPSAAAQVPPSEAAQVPSSAAAQVPPSAASQMPASAAAQVPPSAAAQVPASTAAQVPPSAAPASAPSVLVVESPGWEPEVEFEAPDVADEEVEEAAVDPAPAVAVAPPRRTRTVKRRARPPRKAKKARRTSRSKSWERKQRAALKKQVKSWKKTRKRVEKGIIRALGR